MRLSPRRREDPELNLTSLIDVVLLLVIFFMVSSTFVEEGRYPSHEEAPGFLQRLLGKTRPESRLTVIGPANQLRMIRKDKDMIRAWVSSR